MEKNIVKKVCKELGITQKELAEILDIPQGTVSRWASTDEIPKTAKIALELLLENEKLKKGIEDKYINCVTDIVLSTENYLILMYEPNLEYVIKKEDITGIKTYNLEKNFIIEIYLKEHHNHKYMIAFKYNDYQTGKTAYTKIKQVL